MPIPAFNRLTRTHIISAGGAVAAGAVALACTVVPGSAQASNTPSKAPVAHEVTKAAPAKAKAAPAPKHESAAKPATIKVQPVSYTTSTSSSSYPNNLDGWIRQSLAIMQKNGIPGSYDGIYRNIMRESSGNPNAENDWDSNAAAGTPSKGLLQVIQPTFEAYHVAGTSWNLFDPVANITAACNYAYHVYGSMDNVNSAY